jgi:hypothetical protein
MSTREEKIYGSTYEELRNTLQERLRAHRELNRRAIDLAKIDLLSVSVLVSGITFSGELRDVLLYFTAGVLALLYSLWHCVHVYRLRHFARGLAGEPADEVEAGVVSGISVATHYENLVESYRRAVVSFRDTYYEEVIFVAAAVRVVLPSYPPALDVPVLFAVPVVAFWGRDKYESDEPDTND